MTSAERFPTYEAEERRRGALPPGIEAVPLHGTGAPALPDHVVDAVAAVLARRMSTPPVNGLASLRRALATELERTTTRSVEPGSQILVTNGAMQALGVCFRSLLEPGEVAEYLIRCYPVANVFKAGHCIRLDVTSSSFPRFSRNLNTGEDVGTGTRMQVAHQTVLHTSAYPSRIVLPVIPAS